MTDGEEMMVGDPVRGWPQVGVDGLPVVGPLTQTPQTLRNPLPLRRWRPQAGLNPQGLMLIHTVNIAKSSPLTSHKLQAGQLHKTEAGACY